MNTVCVGYFVYTIFLSLYVNISYYRLPLAGTNLRTEPKYVVFLSHLLLLFNICQVCKHDNPEVEIKESGTNVSIKSKCPSCKQDTDWHSQPYMPASQIRAGNFLLALSIPLSGGSPGKVIKLCNHMGLKCFNPKTYYIYQKVCKVQYNVFKWIIN